MSEDARLIDGRSPVWADRHPRVIFALLIVGTISLSQFNAQRMPFIDPDEGRCVLVVRHMLTHGDWLGLRSPMDEAPYFDKPVFYFWLLAGSFRLFGESELAARFVAALGASLMVGAVYQLGRVLLSPRAALWSALLLATTGLTVIAGRFVRMDVWLTALVAWGVFCWARVQFAGATRWWLLPGCVCLAAACLTKGLIGVILPFGAIGLFLLVRRRPAWTAVRRAQPWWGLVLIVLLAGPWFVYMEWRFPGYANDFFYRHHVLRATSTTYGRAAIPLYMPAMVLAGFLPWTVVLVAAIVTAVQRRRDTTWWRARPGLGLCLWWAVLVIIPFMFFGTKLPVYMMPAFPPLALLAGDYVAGLLDRPGGREARWVGGLTLLLMGLSIATIALANRITYNVAPWVPLAWRVPLFLAFASLSVRWLRTARLRAFLNSAVVLTVALTMDTAIVEAPRLADYFSLRRFAPLVAKYQGNVERILVGTTRPFSLLCYVQPTCPVEHLPHTLDFVAYEHWDRPLLALVTDERLVNMLQSRYGPRVTVLAEGREAWLLKLTR